MSLDLIIQDVELADNHINDNTFDVFFDINKHIFKCFENTDFAPMEFTYQLTDTVENIIKNHNDEIYKYCYCYDYGNNNIYITPIDEVGLIEIFLHGKFLKKL